MKNGLWWLPFLLFLFTLSPGAHGAQPTILFSTTNDVVHAGGTLNVTMTVLNPAGKEIVWNAPEEVTGELRNGKRTIHVSLEFLSERSRQRVVLAPGSFANLDYSVTLPEAALGESILEFPEFAPNKLVLQVAPPLPPEEQKPESRLARWLRDAAPEGSPRAFDPMRFFREHISGYEPLYFIAGLDSPNAKFQVSFKYQLVNQQGRLAQRFPSIERFHLAYTQTSLWDLDAPSAPFFDSSYKPELLYDWQDVFGGGRTDWFRVGVQLGLQHESNGQDGPDSRSLNIAYIRPTFVFGEEKSLQLTLQPRAWVYLPDLDDNPDLAEFRGYGDLRAIIGWKRGLQLSATGRIGESLDHGALQLDLTYPMMRFFYSNFSFYLHAQYFTGYGESLLRYDERSSAFRIGVSMYR